MDLEKVLNQIKAFLSEAEAFLAEGKTDEANAKFAEVEKLEKQAESLKKVQEATVRNEDALAQSKAPVRLPLDITNPPDTGNDSFAKNTHILQYGKIEEAVKAVVTDIY